MQQAAGDHDQLRLRGETALRERKTSVEEYEREIGHIGLFLLLTLTATSTRGCARS